MYKIVKNKFNKKNVTIYNSTSEKVLPEILRNQKGNINFWLDGHYSEGVTFKGENKCPVQFELATIKENLTNFEKISILIDDVRCFSLISHDRDADYPSINYLVDWAREYQFDWHIEHDIFIMQKKGSPIQI